MAGLLTFAWSTAVLLSLEQRFEDAQIAAQRRDGDPRSRSDAP